MENNCCVEIITTATAVLGIFFGSSVKCVDEEFCF